MDLTNQTHVGALLVVLVLAAAVIVFIVGVAWDRGHRIRLNRAATRPRPEAHRPLTAAELNATFQPPHRPEPKPCTTCGQTGPCVTTSGTRARQPHRPRWAVAA